ncbi:MAG: 1,2-phenylacetyl-CoA epoxidase subunit PaaD [Actinocrinis sp.]
MNGHRGTGIRTVRGNELSVQRARQTVCAVPDPEMPYVTLGDLGVVGAVEVSEGARVVRVALKPTYLGCPATEVIQQDVEAALIADGWSAVSIELRFDPPWTPDLITDEGRAKLAAAGVAPPVHGRHEADGPVSVTISLGRPGSSNSAGTDDVVRCPQCGAAQTRLLSAFGPAPCQELRACEVCREPFPAIKARR